MRIRAKSPSLVYNVRTACCPTSIEAFPWSWYWKRNNQFNVLNYPTCNMSMFPSFRVYLSNPQQPVDLIRDSDSVYNVDLAHHSGLLTVAPHSTSLPSPPKRPSQPPQLPNRHVNSLPDDFVGDKPNLRSMSVDDSQMKVRGTSQFYRYVRFWSCVHTCSFDWSPSAKLLRKDNS